MADVVHFDMSGLHRAIRRYETKTKNIPMDLLGTLMVNAADEMFETEGASGSDGVWEPMSPATVVRNPRRAGGQLLQAIGATANIQVDEVSGFSVTIASEADYSGFHISGTDAMPKRDFFAFQFAKVLDDMGDLALQEYQR